MKTIVRDNGFGADALAGRTFLTVGELAAAEGSGWHVDLDESANPELLADYFDRIASIRVRFPDFSDGRGFSIAKRIRKMGFAGTLRAEGHLIADQFVLARRCGFDEVAIDGALARRQPERQWVAAIERAAGSYQDRLLKASRANP